MTRGSASTVASEEAIAAWYSGEVASWAIHPGGPRILVAVEEALGLSREQTNTGLEVLADPGEQLAPFAGCQLPPRPEGGVRGPHCVRVIYPSGCRLVLLHLNSRMDN